MRAQATQRVHQEAIGSGMGALSGSAGGLCEQCPGYPGQQEQPSRSSGSSAVVGRESMKGGSGEAMHQSQRGAMSEVAILGSSAPTQAQAGVMSAGSSGDWQSDTETPAVQAVPVCAYAASSVDASVGLEAER